MKEYEKILYVPKDFDAYDKEKARKAMELFIEEAKQKGIRIIYER